MIAIFSEIVEDLERKLQRRLTKKEHHFVKWVIDQHLKEKIIRK